MISAYFQHVAFWLLAKISTRGSPEHIDNGRAGSSFHSTEGKNKGGREHGHGTGAMGGMGMGSDRDKGLGGGHG